MAEGQQAQQPEAEDPVGQQAQGNWQDPSLIPQTSQETTPYVPQEAKNPVGQQAQTRCWVCSVDEHTCFPYGVRSCHPCAKHFTSCISIPHFFEMCDNPGTCPLRRDPGVEPERCRYCLTIACLRLGMHTKHWKYGSRPGELAEPRHLDPMDYDKMKEFLEACYEESILQLGRLRCSVCESTQNVEWNFGVISCEDCVNIFSHCISSDIKYSGICDNPGTCSLRRDRGGFRPGRGPPICQDCLIIACLRSGMDPKYDVNLFDYGFFEVAKPRDFDPADKDTIIEIMMDCRESYTTYMKTEECYCIQSVKPPRGTFKKIFWMPYNLRRIRSKMEAKNPVGQQAQEAEDPVGQQAQEDGEPATKRGRID